MKVKENLEVQLEEGISAQLWHLRLGHLHEHAIVDLINNKSIIACNKNVDLCSSCLFSKAHVLPHKQRKMIYKYPFKLIFVDPWGLGFRVYRLLLYQRDIDFMSLLWMPYQILTEPI